MIAVLALGGAAPAGAGGGGQYALASTVEIRASGPVRIDLPASWVARCPDPTSYLLVDGAGAEVSYAVRTSDGAPPGREPLTWEPLERSPWSWTYLVHAPRSGGRTKALSVRGVPERRVVEVTVRRPSGQVVLRDLVWNLPGTGAGVSHEVALPPGEQDGPWRVDLHVVNVWRARPWAEFEAVTEAIDQVSPVSWTVPVQPPEALGPRDSQLLVPLPRGGLPVRGLHLSASDPVYVRPVSVFDGRGTPLGQGTIQRFRHGEVSIDTADVPVRATVSGQIRVDLVDERSVPLSIGEVGLTLRGLALLASGGEPGRWTVYGCGPAGARYDVERLADELFAVSTPRVAPEPPRPNPAWTASLVTGGLAGPGQPVSGRPERLGTVGGEAGLVRFPLPAEVIAKARTDLGDLRFVDAQRQQIPYLSGPTGPVSVPVSAGVTEEGATTVLRVSLPIAGLPLRQLVVHTDSPRFRRPVTVTGAGRAMDTLWEGSGGETSRLVVPLEGRAGATIEVRIDNGDNAPLALLPPTVSRDGAEVWLVLPEQGADLLLLGGQRAPRYDLELLRSEIVDGPALPAAVTTSERPIPPLPVRAPPPVEPAAIPPMSPLERRPWVTPVIALCAAIIGGIGLRLARAPAR